MSGARMVKEIFWETQTVKDKALKLAEPKFPFISVNNKEYARYLEEINNRLLKELCLKYGITEKRLNAIKREGLLKGWSSLSRK